MLRGYTDKTAIENYMLTEVDGSFDDQLDEWIEAMEEEMDSITDRQLMSYENEGEEEDVRKFDGNGKSEMLIDDFSSITEIAVEDEVIEIDEDVYLYPANKEYKYQLKRSNGIFPKGLQNVSVTGVAGMYTSANWPKRLKFACTVLVAGIINYSNTHSGEVKKESIGRYTVEYVTDQEKKDFETAKQTLEHYRRIR